MERKIAERWAKALRSGEYVQGHSSNLRVERIRKCKSFVTYSALGVLCELAIKDGVGMMVVSTRTGDAYLQTYDGMRKTLPKVVMDWAGIRTVRGEVAFRGVDYLYEMGLDGRLFMDMADVVEKNWEDL